MSCCFIIIPGGSSTLHRVSIAGIYLTIVSCTTLKSAYFCLNG
uniref:Uncharacterized protein n=1 Tax=Rhizophora mucronata TaxID=61149 RepID=A0A2P2PAQ9_RHIMU